MLMCILLAVVVQLMMLLIHSESVSNLSAEMGISPSQNTLLGVLPAVCMSCCK